MTRRLAADALLRDLPEHSVGLALPQPISARLDALVRLMDESGERTNRKELVAALILAADPQSGQVAALLRRYRTARARDTLLEPNEALSVLVLPTPGPGPRRRR